MGYSQAGFDVVGIDIAPQPRYPFPFVQADALEWLSSAAWRGFQAIHASPPCQKYTALKSMWNAREHPDLVAPVRERLKATGLPYVIENVPGAPLENAIVLCGSMFGLGCEQAELRRHRLFEVNPPLLLTPCCQHGWKRRTVAVYGHSGGSSRREAAVIGVYGGHGRDRRRRTNGQRFSVADRAEAMAINWMGGDELSQAIPPAYTHFIALSLLQEVRR